MDIATSDMAGPVIAIIRLHEAVLRSAGVRMLSLFGSVARGDCGQDSDIDLAAVFDPAARVDLFRLVALERELTAILGRNVQILPEPISSARLKANVEKDRVRVF